MTLTLRQTRTTVYCCDAGMIVLAMVINLSPLLFIPLREEFALSFEQLGRLILINFTTQVSFDLICGALVDRVGLKPFAVTANFLVCVGLFTMSLAGTVPLPPYTVLIIGTIIFSMGGGILELILSPIVNALPSDHKEADMSMLHSFYSTGQLLVVLITALALFLCGKNAWRVIVLTWTLLPLVTGFFFLNVTIPPMVHEDSRLKIRRLIREPIFLTLLLAIAMAGAAELVLTQWISAFAEAGLKLTKITGDLLGFSLFALAMAIGRIALGRKESSINMPRLLIRCCLAAAIMIIIAALAPWPAVSLAACALAGFGMFALWPGVLSIAAARFPLAGASMFALLAAAGDMGGAVVPWTVGWIADWHGLNWGLLVSAICPLAMLIALLAIRKKL